MLSRVGDHVWDQKNFENEIDGLEEVCRPANLPEQNPGRTHLVVEKSRLSARHFYCAWAQLFNAKVELPVQNGGYEAG